jgi:diaminopimelate decarboxylase
VADAVRWSVATASFELSYLNVGGGLGVDYTGEDELDLCVLRSGLAAAVADLPSGVELVFEPGRFLVADAGWYAAEVLDLKSTHGRWFAVLRGGTHHFRLPAAWGYSHPFTVLPVESWPYPFPRLGVSDVQVDVVGELCTPRDVLSRQARVDRLRIGDVLLFGRAGGYGWDISHHDFLHHAHPDFLVL